MHLIMLTDDSSAMVAAVCTALAAALLLIANWLWRCWLERGRCDGSGDEADLLPLPPGDMGFMMVGETAELAWQGYDFFRRRREKYGQIYKTHLFGQPTIRVYGSDNLATILKSEELFVTMHWPKSVKMVLGDKAVAHLTRREHSLRRVHLLRVFNHNVVPRCIERVRATVRSRLDSWCKIGRIMGCNESRRLAMEIVMRAVMGMTVSERLLDELYHAMTAIEQGLFSLPYDLPGTGTRKAIKARQFIASHLTRAMAAQHDSSGDSDGSFFRTLQQTDGGHNLTDREVQDECMSMLTSGFQGLSSVTCTLLMELTRHPECASRARQELEEAGVLPNGSCSGESGDGGGESTLTYDRLLKLHYVNNVVKEALRKVPPVGGGYRKVLKTFELGGYRIPKGWTVLYSIRDQHEVGDTGIDDPNEFDPDRWSDERQRLSAPAATSNYAYMPFGGDGQRSCVGARFVQAALAVVVVELVSGFRWTHGDDSGVGGLPKMKYFPVPYPVDGLPLVFERNR